MCQSLQKPIIGCLYGYGERGELNGADHLAEHIEDIPQFGDMRMSSALSESRSCTLTEGIGLMGMA